MRLTVGNLVVGCILLELMPVKGVSYFWCRQLLLVGDGDCEDREILYVYIIYLSCARILFSFCVTIAFSNIKDF